MGNAEHHHVARIMYYTNMSLWTLWNWFERGLYFIELGASTAVNENDGSMVDLKNVHAYVVAVSGRRG